MHFSFSIQCFYSCMCHEFKEIRSRDLIEYRFYEYFNCSTLLFFLYYTTTTTTTTTTATTACTARPPRPIHLLFSPVIFLIFCFAITKYNIYYHIQWISLAILVRNMCVCVCVCACVCVCMRACRYIKLNQANVISNGKKYEGRTESDEQQFFVK